MKKWLWGLLMFLGTMPLVHAEVKKSSFQSLVNTVWYCMYCGFMNDDKYSRCRNWDCPTNKSVE